MSDRKTTGIDWEVELESAPNVVLDAASELYHDDWLFSVLEWAAFIERRRIRESVEDVISQGIESWARPYRFDERYHLGLGDIRVTPSMLDDLADRIKAAITEGEDD